MSSSSLNTDRDSASGCTDVKSEHFTYEWVIKKFKLLPQENGEHIYSPTFRTPKSEVDWRLCLYPHGVKTKEVDYISIYLHLHLHTRESKGRKVKVHCEISIIPSAVTHKFDRTYVFGEKRGHGSSQIMSRSKLLELLSADDTVTIRCTLDIPLKTITEPINTEKCLEESFDSEEGQLSQAFRPLFKESKLSDVSVIVGTQKFPAHKVVLAARSPVFSAMFENKETRENLKNEVKIEEMEPTVVEAMLEFFYTDEVTNLEELVYGLLEAADKYDVQRLRSMCERVLYKTLNTENAAEILVHADLHGSYKLKKHVMEFMDDHLSDVVKMNSYKEIEDPKLLKEFVGSIADRKESRRLRFKPYSITSFFKTR